MPGTEREFYYEPETTIRRSSSEPSGRPLLQILEESGVNFPLQRGQEVVVTRKPHPKLPGRKLALRITVAEPR